MYHIVKTTTNICWKSFSCKL